MSTPTFSVYSVHLPTQFYNYFCSSEGAYGTPTRPTAWVKTDSNGLLFTLEQVPDAKLPNGTEIKNQQRLVRFDESELPLEKRVRSPNPSVYLLQLTDWTFGSAFISYFNTRDYGTSIATKSQIEQGGSVLSNKEQENGCLYLSNDKTKIYLGKMENGSLVPVVIPVERNTDLPSCVFVYSKFTDPTKIIDTRPYNSNYGPILAYLFNPSGSVDTMTVNKQVVASKYTFIRIPQLFRYSFLWNFPLVDKKFPTLSSSIIQNVLKSGWKLATLDDAKSLVGANTGMYNTTGEFSFTVDSSGALLTLDKKLSGTSVSLVPEDGSPGARAGQVFLILVKSDTVMTETTGIGDILDLGKTFAEIGSVNTSSSASKNKLFLILGVTLGGLILLALAVYLLSRKREGDLVSTEPSA